MPVIVPPGPDEPLSRDGAETWSQLRMMRSDPPGFARSDAERQQRFRAALEQSQHFYEAALTAPSDTRPVLLFYCCGQVLKAWAAAGLPDYWRPNSHGLKVGDIPEPSGQLSDVTITLHPAKPSKQSSDFNTLRRLNGEEPVGLSEKVSVGEIWGFMSSSYDIAVPLAGAEPAITYLSLFPYRHTDQTLPAAHDRDAAYQVSTSHALISESDGLRQRMIDALPRNFARIGRCEPWPLADSLSLRGVSTPPAVLDLDVADLSIQLAPLLDRGPVSLPAQVNNRISFRHIDLVWLVLAALADVARYEPEFWRACMDVDQTRDSESLVAFLNYAQWYLPGVAHRKLHALDVA